MKASDAKRAAFLVAALNDLGNLDNDLLKCPTRERDRRVLQLMVCDLDDQGDISSHEYIYIDAKMGRALIPTIRDLLESELRAMGVDLEG